MKLLSVGDVARILGVRPSKITQLFYERRLDDDLCPIVGGRRLIPAEYVEIIAMELRRKGVALGVQNKGMKGIENVGIK
ncbi:MAG: hypothetical protein ACYTF1_22860 [Planctomycetota bacterium]|jgi:hypothetical protein